ncbi:hypothetical protein FRC17_005423 [Serendipita sp. 399]|nr:hypothetical protein FRC17_005423 [Serendipita sp. 399]
MGKPLGILHRIFSFSKGSKRSKDLFDPGAVNEHGHHVDPDDEGQGQTGTVRTTGGMGGLGMGITNVDSEIAGKPLGASSKSSGRGMKKRRLRRASLSASNLLSWGQERGISSYASSSIHRDDKAHRLSPHETQGPGAPSGPHFSRSLPRKATSPGPELPHEARSKQLEAEEKFTRLLRSSSTKYRVLSEQNFGEIAPIEHPIQVISSKDKDSETLPQERAYTSLPRGRAQSLGFHSLLPNAKPSIVPSMPSTISLTSNYRVTVHRRRVHSRTSFPEANRALDQLNSTELEPSGRGSPRVALEVPDISLSGSAIHLNSTDTTSPIESKEEPMNGIIGTVNREPSNRLQRPSVATMRIVNPSPCQSAETTLSPSPGLELMNQSSPANHPERHQFGISRQDSNNSTRSLHAASTADEAQGEIHETIPQEPKEFGRMSCDAYSISLKADDSMDIAYSPTKSQASKTKKVLRKKWRGSQTSVHNDSDAPLAVQDDQRGSHQQSKLAKNTKTKRKGSIHNILSIINTVEGIFDRTSTANGTRQKARSVLRDDNHRTPKVGALFSPLAINGPRTPSPTKCTLPRENLDVAETYCDEERLNHLRNDPSVASLLDVYQADGTLKRSTFSNTPVKFLRRNLSERRSDILVTVSTLTRGKSLGRNKSIKEDEGAEAIERGPFESRTMKMRRMYDQALTTSISSSPRVSKETQDYAPSDTRTTEMVEFPLGPNSFAIPVSRFSSDSQDSFATNTPSSNLHSRAPSGIQQVNAQIVQDSSALSNSTISSQVETSALAEASMVVEPGSKGDARHKIDLDSSMEDISMDCVHEDIFNPLKKPDHPQGIDQYESPHKSPQRRASEVFSFLDGKKGSGANVGGEPFNPRISILGNCLANARSGLDLATSLVPQVGQSLQEASPEIPAVPLANTTVGSDSFASQNSTDRVLLRGIYSFLRRIDSRDAMSQAPPETPASDHLQVEGTSQIRIDQKETDPFRGSPININKELPSTPADKESRPDLIVTLSNLSQTPEKRVFTPLPLLPLISPLGNSLPPCNHQTVGSPTKSTSNALTNRNTKSPALKFENNRMSISGLDQQRRPGSIHRTNSVARTNHTKVNSLSSSNHMREQGLGDGRNFNIASSKQSGKMFGPRSPRTAAPKVASNNRSHTVERKVGTEASKERAPSVKRPAGRATPNRPKQVNIIEGYPFSEDLFPAILTPSGPDISRPMSHLQTPQRNSSFLEPSPASSSKLELIMMNEEMFAAATARLPTEIMHHILIAGVKERNRGKIFGARCMRLASWIRPWVAPALYHDVDLWTEQQASSFLYAIQSTELPHSLPLASMVLSLAVKTIAFSAYDTQHPQSRILPQTEAGNFTPAGATSLTVMKILSALMREEKDGVLPLRHLSVPMVILATKRQPDFPLLPMPRSVTITGVDGLIWNAYGWGMVTHVRLTSYNPMFQETKWFLRLPALTHLAFAFYYEIPIGLRIAEELTAAPQIRCVVMLVYPPVQGGRGRTAARDSRKELQKLDEPSLIIWEDTPQMVAKFEDEDADRFWRSVERIVDTQRKEKAEALNGM